MRALNVWILLLLCVSAVYAAPTLRDLQVSPQRLVGGDTVTISYTLADFEPLGRVSTDVYLEDAIYHRDIERAGGLVYEYENIFAIPDDWEGTGPLLLKVDTSYEPPLHPTYTIEIVALPSSAGANERSTSRTSQVTQTSRDGHVSVLVEPLRTLEQGITVFFPVTLTNHHTEPQEVLLGVQDVRSFGAFSVEPQQVITVAPGERRIVYLALAIDEDAELGMHDLVLTMEHDGVREMVPTSIAIIAQEEHPERGIPAWFIIGILLIVLIAIIIAVIAWYKGKEESDEDLITYY